MIQFLTIMIQGKKAEMDERGASAVEYGLLIAGIAAVIVVAVMALGPIVKEAFNDTCTAITGAEGSTVSGDCKTGTPPAAD